MLRHRSVVFRGTLARTAESVSRSEGVEVAGAAQAFANGGLGFVDVAVAHRQREPAGLHRDGGGPAAEPLGDLLVGEAAHPHLDEGALLLAGPQALAHSAAGGPGGGRAFGRRPGFGGAADPGPAVDDAPLAEGPNCGLRAGRVGGAVAAGQRELGGLRRDGIRCALEPIGDLLAGAVGQPHFDEDVFVPEGPANQPLRVAGPLACGGAAFS